MEAAAVESISKALGLPRPFLHEPNRAFTQLETWQQLTALLATQPVRIKPLGYYRTPDSVDIYVFECTLGDAGRYSWKIYRRYRHFQKYIAHSSELLASRSVRVPRLSQAYLKIFHAQHCKDRLVELHKWLEGVAESTQSYCLQLQHKQEQQEREKLLALQQQRLAQLEQQARLKAARKQHKTHSSSNATAARPDVPTTSMSTGRLRAPSTTASSRRRSSISLKTVEQQGDPALYVLRTDKAEALPVVMLSCFLFAGANCPFSHVFRGMPTFALAMEELNVQLTQAAPAAYPSKLKNSMTSRAGLGLRLTASHEQEGQFLGATVAGFLRDQQELDPALADVPVGAKLVRVNGVNVSDAPFDQVLVQLRGAGLPLRLRFLYNPNLNRQRSNSLTPRSSIDATSDVESLSGRQRVVSSASGGSSSGNSMAGPIETGKPPMDRSHRSYSVDAPRLTSGLFGSVFGDLFGAASTSAASGTPPSSSSGIISAAGKQRGETADIAVGSTHGMLNPAAALFAWDDVSGGSRDLISRGFFSYLPPSLLHELRQKRRAEMKAKAFLPEHDLSDSEDSDDNQRSEDIKATMSRKAQGVWSTATGPMGLSFGACKICDVEAAMLEASPVFFSSRAEHRGSEKRLCKGFVLVSINNESTFDAPFAVVIKRLRSASRPTSLCFRWYQDYSPFLETELAEQHGSSIHRSSSLVKSHAIGAKVFVNNLDCVAEAQTDLSNSLQLALMENASIRDEIGVLQDAHRELRLAQERAAQRELILQAKIEQSDVMIAKLNEEVDIQRQELEKSRLRAQEAEATLATNKREYQAMLEKAQESAKTRLAEHEEQLVKESNRSIENANRMAERRAQKMLESAENESQRKHEEYLQKLAEEHSEEVESLMQQVAVWRHQVEVLTEAEKRNYAALVSNGVNPYGDYQRSRFGYSSSDSPFADLKSGGSSDLQAPRRKPGKAQESSVSTAATAAKWRDGSPEDDKHKSHAFSGTSDQSSQSNNGTFWDRMVSLLATE
ncbi:Lysine-specific demethylase 7B [Phytophthora cinnamomi]|uniref:Lysine-specific demethylase 7B n=1 Tax=Phytophthora cinnamomi TaxID=4785 RepID=UPI00355AA22D|nr:Lysine-specific demethylase 7B [Phytophthora cinnamomi]